MAVQNEGTRTFTTGGAITQYARVKFHTTQDDDGVQTVVEAGSDEAAIGFAQDDAASGARVAVRLETRGKTFKAIADEAFAAGASLYGDANRLAGNLYGNQDWASGANLLKNSVGAGSLGMGSLQSGMGVAGNVAGYTPERFTEQPSCGWRDRYQL